MQCSMQSPRMGFRTRQPPRQQAGIQLASEREFSTRKSPTTVSFAIESSPSIIRIFHPRHAQVRTAVPLDALVVLLECHSVDRTHIFAEYFPYIPSTSTYT